MSKLIILRGPSGAGKSTVAKRLHELNSGKSVLIEQDYYKEVMVRPKEESGELRRRLILSNTHLSLESGYDVILDGIFHLRVYSDFFTELFDTHS
jgi:uridine kinase